jgi:hypothetical protein
MMAGSLLTTLVKRYVNTEDVPFRVILDLATFTMMTS